MEDSISKLETIGELAANPLKAFTNVGKVGLKKFGSFIGVCILFALVNLIFVIAAVIRLGFVAKFSSNGIWYSLIAIAFGIGITIFAGYRAYQYALMETIRSIYEEAKPLVLNICAKLIGLAENIFKNKNGSSENLQKAINIKNIIEERYNNLPAIVRKGLILLLNRLPLGMMLFKIKGDVEAGNKEVASKILFNEINLLLNNTIFADNTLRWVMWILPINIIVEIFIIWYCIV